LRRTHYRERLDGWLLLLLLLLLLGVGASETRKVKKHGSLALLSGLPDGHRHRLGTTGCSGKNWRVKECGDGAAACVCVCVCCVRRLRSVMPCRCCVLDDVLLEERQSELHWETVVKGAASQGLINTSSLVA
jgi:hypothetical protein